MKMIDLFKPNILIDNLNDLHTISLDDSDKSHPQYMTTSDFKAVDFDAVKEKYVFSNSSIPACDMRSNDALVILCANIPQFVFIEFKNGVITSTNAKEKIRVKIAESLLIFNDLMEENLTFDRTHINYILVYNSSNNKSFEEQRNENSLNKIASILATKSKMTYLINGFDRYRAFFHDVKTINEIEFQDVVAELENSTYVF